MKNMYVKDPKEVWDIRFYLLAGGIDAVIQKESFDSIKDSLWDLVTAITSRIDKDFVDFEVVKLLDCLGNVELMVKGAHYFLHHKKRLAYEEDWIDIKWSENPYRCLEKFRSNEDSLLNHHLAHFKESFTILNKNEAQNFVVAFENFFYEMDLSSWLNLIDDWKNCITHNDNIFDSNIDDTPIKTYEQLLKLCEACYVAKLWSECDYPPPNRHLIEDYLGTEYVNGYKSASPYEMIYDIFYEDSYAHIRQDILSLYPQGGSNKRLMSRSSWDLRHKLTWLLETGWLFLQTDYFPEDWLNADAMDCIRCPIPEKEIRLWKSKSLSVLEEKDLQETLSSLYYDIDVRRNIYYVESRIIGYYGEEQIAQMDDEDLGILNRLLKTLDILTLIVLDVLSYRTNKEAVFYPAHEQAGLKTEE